MRRLAFGLAILLLSAVACGDDSTEFGAGVPCGAGTCSDVEYCCDAACGLCVEEGVACTETCE